MRDDEDDFTIPPEMIARRSAAKPKKLTGYAPFPYAWMQALASCTSAATFKVALYVLKEGVWMLEARPVPMPGTVAELIGMSPRTMYYAIRELESLGLVVAGQGP